MKKLFSLLTLLLLLCTSAWGDTEFVIFNGTGSTMPSSSRQTDATTGFAYTCNNFKSSFTDVSAYTNHGSYSNAIRYGGGTTSSKNHVKLEIPDNYTATIDIVYGGTATNTKWGVSTDGTKPAGSNCDTWNATASSSSTLYSASIEDLEGDAIYYVGGSGDGCVIAYLKVTLSGGGGGGSSKYSITYHCNDATGDCPENLTQQTNLPNPLPVITKTNYSLTWCTDAALSTPAEAGALLSANADLYAKWTQIGSIDKNGGSANTTYTATWKATSISIASAPTKSGYRITGYYTANSGGTKIADADGTLIASTSYTDDSQKWTNTGSAPTLYAQWEEVNVWSIFDGSIDNDFASSPISNKGVSLEYVTNSKPNSSTDVSSKTNNIGNDKNYQKGYQFAATSTEGNGANYLRFTIPTGYSATFTHAFGGSGNNRVIMLSTKVINSATSDGHIATLATLPSSGGKSVIEGGEYSTKLSSGTYYICGGEGGWQVVELIFTLYHEIKLTAATWASYSSTSETTIPEGVTAYRASASANDAVTLSEITSGIVPANTGVVLHGPANTYHALISATGETIGGTNLLQAWTSVGTPTEDIYYTLAIDNNTDKNPVFMRSSGGELAAGKAYLVLPTTSGNAPSVIRVVDEENNATDINSIEETDKAVKFIENGRILIMRDGIVYDALGRVVR